MDRLNLAARVGEKEGVRMVHIIEAAMYIRNGDYEIIGIPPVGAVFIFTNDNTISSIMDLAGMQMAVLDSMPEMRQLAVDLGMTPVSSTVTIFRFAQWCQMG